MTKKILTCLQKPKVGDMWIRNDQHVSAVICVVRINVSGIIAQEYQFGELARPDTHTWSFTEYLELGQRTIKPGVLFMRRKL